MSDNLSITIYRERETKTSIKLVNETGKGKKAYIDLPEQKDNGTNYI